MSKRRQPERKQQPRRNKIGWWPIAVVVVLAIAAVGGLIWLGQGTGERPQVTVATAGKVKGDPAAPIEIEEWADFQCPACQFFATETATQLAERYIAEGKVKVVFRHLAFIGQESLWAAEAAECAAEQDRFWDYHDKLFAEQAGENRGAFSRSNLKRFASEIGLDSEQFNACFDSGRYAAQVQAETQAGRQKGVQATPTLFVNGQMIRGAPRFEQLRQIIESVARTPAAAAARSGR